MKKVILAVVILIVLVIVIGGIYVFTHRDQLIAKVMEKSLGSLQKAMIGNLQTDEKKAEAEAIFRKLGEKIKTGAIDKKEMQDLGLTLQKSFADKKLDEKETEMIMQKLKKMVGQTDASP